MGDNWLGQSSLVFERFFFFFFFELEVYCPLRKQQDMIVQLSVTSYVYHLETQEKLDNRLSSRSHVNKTESAKHSGHRGRPRRKSQRVWVSRQRMKERVTM